MIASAIDFFLDFLFPKRCVGCKGEGSMLCQPCKEAIPTITAVCFVCERRSPEGEICAPCRGRTRIRRFIAPLPFHEPAVRELIHALKYAGIHDIASTLAGYISTYIKEVHLALPERVLLLPIPLHPKRLRERGFNQAEAIALELSSSLKVAMDTKLLQKTAYRAPQTTMKTRTEREKNARNMYQITGAIPDGVTIILVDDVSTTGATLEEAARVLREAGAKQVWAFTAARS